VNIPALAASSSFTSVPEPGMMGVVGVVMLLLGRRKR
jgi:hypothetical protein